MPSKDQTFTYQTRIPMEASAAIIMQSCAEVLARVERNLFADIASGKNAGTLKSQYLQEYRITARLYNAIRVQLEGKIASIKERLAGQIIETKQKIVSIKKRIEKLKKSAPHSNKCHQKKRLLFNLENKLKRLQWEQATGKVSICFGSKKLFQAQFDLEANGYKNHEEWLLEWRHSRKNSFFFLGSKDETGGNQSCTATIAENGSLTLRIRLPDGLTEIHGKYLVFPEIRFDYGHQNIINALKSCEERKRLQALKDPNATSHGQPISYRFKCDEKGWRVFVSIPVAKAPSITSVKQGVIGIDINANHLAISETDRFGNPVAKKSMPLNTYGKNQDQTKALIGDACANLIAYAKQTGKTLVIECLDFQQKKAELKGQSNATYARMISGFAYSHIKSCLKSQAWREGVEVGEVNPAYTSVIGRVKFARRYGLSVHQAAALVIGRRYLKASERIPRHLETIPDGKEGYVALSLPVRNRDKHVWHYWRILSRKLKTVLAAQFRAIKKRSSSLKSALATNTIPDLGGEIPTREFVNTTARLACVDISTSVYA